jgi:tRNA pseudouridine55 synthase
VACSKGTYVRSLVADIGTALGAGAHLAELRRTRAGRFAIDQAVTLDRLREATLVSPDRATDLPVVTVPRTLIAQVYSGVQLPAAALSAHGLEQFQLLDEDGRLLAVAHAAAGLTVYDRVFPELRGP